MNGNKSRSSRKEVNEFKSEKTILNHPTQQFDEQNKERQQVQIIALSLKNEKPELKC